ncbi:MAG: carboxymuconolactone decarboxylase family protein [Xanthobacteraceae bacterium]|nr:carboxymuconolactone decarboxylase family protein [Xanthobacteraceae bacterium]
MDRFAVAAILATVLAAAPTLALAQQRLPTVPPEHYDDEQKKAAEEFLAARKAPVFGPFEPMMHSPQVMNLARATGDYLRYHSSIGNTLSELVILITAREWSQDFEWSVHYPIALKAGIARDTADAVADGRRPAGMSTDEEIVYDFATELLKTKRVSDPTYARAERRFGNKGIVDITGICGYYSFLAMQLNVARYPVAGDAPGLSRFPN